MQKLFAHCLWCPRGQISPRVEHFPQFTVSFLTCKKLARFFSPLWCRGFFFFMEGRPILAQRWGRGRSPSSRTHGWTPSPTPRGSGQSSRTPARPFARPSAHRWCALAHLSDISFSFLAFCTIPCALHNDPLFVFLYTPRGGGDGEGTGVFTPTFFYNFLPMVCPCPSLSTFPSS